MFECNCPCHTDHTMKHCDNLTCMPCCTACDICQKKIQFGKMRTHQLQDHDVQSPPLSQETIDKLRTAIQQLIDADPSDQ